ncbi:MAG: HAMP domain-containing sensor histidine kinase [Lysobacteraceae bacterium]
MFRLLPRKTTLRMRVVLCCAALGGVVGIFQAFVAEAISERDERLLINEEMTAEIGVQIAQHGADPDARLPRSAWKSLYIDRPGQAPTSPPELRSLAPGIHELDDLEDSDRFAAIRIAPIGRVTMVAGLPNSPARERRFAEELLAMILLGSLLGAWLGRMLASNMIAPVLRLSHEVDTSEQIGELQRIADDHRSDEVGALAGALVRYRTRMRTAIEREILFSADASHELRTPLTVLQSGLDLMHECAGVTTVAQRRIARMQRGAAEMSTLLDALLLIARSNDAADAPHAAVEIGPALASVASEFRDELATAQVEIGLRCAQDACINAPPELLRVVLRLLFSSIANGAYGSHLRIDADAHHIALTSTDGVSQALEENDGHDSNPASADALRSDQNGGTGMLRRLCQRYGWSLEFGHDQSLPALLFIRIWSPDAILPE